MQYLLSLEGKKAIITGAAKGIGKDIAVVFAKLGANSFLVDINETALSETVREVGKQGQKVYPKVADITDSKSLQDIVQEAIMKMGCSGACTGTHLHFEVWEKGTFIDPKKYFTFQDKLLCVANKLFSYV